LSSRVLLVSNLRRSNWKCTVMRFFKSTVMSDVWMCEQQPHHREVSYSKQSKAWMQSCLPGVEVLVICSSGVCLPTYPARNLHPRDRGFDKNKTDKSKRRH
jgi:hypothetical protein